jgi:hypothetical protein
MRWVAIPPSAVFRPREVTPNRGDNVADPEGSALSYEELEGLITPQKSRAFRDALDNSRTERRLIAEPEPIGTRTIGGLR